MISPISITPDHIAERNKRNAQHSTGPRTSEGKEISRRNSLKHGLTANPADGVIEDPEDFERLHFAIIEHLEPRDILEDGMAHRIAVSMWRLQRATQIESAITSIQVKAIQPVREQIQEQVMFIREYWDQQERWETKEELKLRQRKERNPNLVKQSKLIRFRLHSLDCHREELMRKGVAIAAMCDLLAEQYTLLEFSPYSFSAECAEMMAWLLGEPASTFSELGGEDIRYPDEQPDCSDIVRLIKEARTRERDQSVPAQLESMTRNKLMELRACKHECDEPIDKESHDQHRIAALLLDAPLMDRILRYETQAERSLFRALEGLARMRGETVEMIMTRISR